MKPVFNANQGAIVTGMSGLMRTSLDHLPARKRRELARALEILHAEFQEATAFATADWKRSGRILRIVLFGSHARGDWVDEPHTKKGYRSDYDLLVIVSNRKLTDFSDFWHKAEDRLLREAKDGPAVNFIVHTMDEANSALKAGQYFFCDIVKEGILLYELKGATAFIAPEPPTPEAAFETAKEHADYWLPSATDFYHHAQIAIDRKTGNKAAFFLHQCVENLYTAILLAFTNYSPKSHNIKFLRGLTEQLDARLIDAWPRETRAERSRFELLKRAYVEARYSKHYEIAEEDLAWLSQRTANLHTLAETLCTERLATLKAKTGAKTGTEIGGETEEDAKGGK